MSSFSLGRESGRGCTNSNDSSGVIPSSVFGVKRRETILTRCAVIATNFFLNVFGLDVPCCQPNLKP